jgi:peroxiredoxin
MSNILLLAFISITLYSHLQAANVTISGTDSAYAGTQVEFVMYADQISNSELTLGITSFARDGSFSLSFELKETGYVFAYIGIYRIFLFAEPDSEYSVVLPPRSDKQPGDLLNPYFTPVDVHLATTNFEDDELNTLIRMFNDAYLPYYNKHIMAIRNKEDFSDLDKDIARMDKPFEYSKNKYFNEYRWYQYGRLRYLAVQQKSKSISGEYFRGRPVLLSNPAYMELFNKVYEKYFHHFERTEEGKGLGEAIGDGDLNRLRKLLAKDDVLGDSGLLDLVILKGLHDEFYNDKYSRSALLEILNQMISGNKFPALTDVAENIRIKTTRLLTGFEPPEFELYDRDSNLISLRNFRGKYVYLNFCSCFSYTCLNEFKMISSLYAKHKDILEVVTIIVDNDKDVINSFLDRSNYSWVFLHYGHQSAVIKDYDIRAFPTYYLIDREGKLVISPAPAAGDEFETHLFKIMRSRGEL